MAYKLVVWFAISLAVGWAVSYLLDPAAVIYTVVVFSIPFVVFGFQDNYRTDRKSYSLFGFTLYSARTEYRQLTFWGFPVGQEQRMRDEHAYFENLGDYMRVLPFIEKVLPTVGSRIITGTRLLTRR